MPEDERLFLYFAYAEKARRRIDAVKTIQKQKQREIKQTYEYEYDM
jgi:hypothetical protein